MPSFSTRWRCSGLPRLGAEPLDALGGVVAAESGEVHAGDGAEQPGGLPLFLHACGGCRWWLARRSTALVLTRISSTHSRLSGMRRFGSKDRPLSCTGTECVKGGLLLLLFHCHKCISAKKLAQRKSL